MIFKFFKSFVSSVPSNVLSDVCSAIIERNHFIKTESPDVEDYIIKAIRDNGSKTQKDNLPLYAGFSTTGLQDKYFQVFEVREGVPVSWLKWMISNPSLVILENLHHEWPTYMKLLNHYSDDDRFGTLWDFVLKSYEQGLIDGCHAGGHKGMVKAKHHIIHNNPDGVPYLNKKTMFVFDRDTDDCQSYDSEKKDLFKHICRKFPSRVTEADIYCIKPIPIFWHMWYKREIENYFDDEAYSQNNIGPVETNGTDRNYFKICPESTHKYKKSELEKLAASMDMKRMEAICKKFGITEETEEVSEMQLFFLKLVKII